MILSLLLSVATSTSWALNSGCHDRLLEDPIAIGFEDGPIGSVRRACPRSQVSLEAGGILIAEPEEFYGNLRAAAVLEASYAIGRNEIFVALELVRFQTVISSLSASNFGVGHLAIGGTHLLSEGKTTAAITAHATLPTAVGLYENSYPIAIDIGLTGSERVFEHFETHGYLGARGSFGVGTGPLALRSALLLDVGIGWRAVDPLAVVVDMEAALGSRAVLDHLAIGLGVRAALFDGLLVALLLKSPFAGDERSLVSAHFGLDWIF